jgi:hypothetical protein
MVPDRISPADRLLLTPALEVSPSVAAGDRLNRWRQDKYIAVSVKRKTWWHRELHIELCLMDGQHTAPLYIIITNMLTVAKFENLSRRINSVTICTSYSVNYTHKRIPKLFN